MEITRLDMSDESVSIPRIAKFQKVSEAQFIRDYLAYYPETDVTDINKIYNAIQLPKRATGGSAGYDFHSTVKAVIGQRGQAIIPTGIRVRIDPGWHLKLYPRSSYGMTYRLQLDNTVGVIDTDYYNAKNEGHIMIKVTNDSVVATTLHLEIGDRFAQGIFEQFGICVDDNVDTKRIGGMGSTGN